MNDQTNNFPLQILLMQRQLDTSVNLPVWPDDLHFTPFSKTIAPEIHSLLQIGFKNTQNSIPVFSQWFTALISDSEFDPALCFVIKDKERIIGYAQCWTSAFIKDLVIHPEQRKRGLGTLLLQQAFYVFKERNFETVALKVLSNNINAIRLYTSCGMQIS